MFKRRCLKINSDGDFFTKTGKEFHKLAMRKQNVVN